MVHDELIFFLSFIIFVDTFNNFFFEFQIDEGWWRGYCKGQYGLFPANYVALQ